MIQHTIVTSTSISAYIRREEVELVQDGHAEQHSEQAVLPQQHASCKDKDIYRLKTHLLIKKKGVNLYSIV